MEAARATKSDQKFKSPTFASGGRFALLDAGQRQIETRDGEFILILSGDKREPTRRNVSCRDGNL